MTAAQLLQIFRDFTKSSLDTTFLSDAEAYRFLTMAQEEIMIKMVEHHQGWFEATDTVYLVSGTQEYDLPSDIFMGKILIVEWVSTSGEYYPMRLIDKRKRSVLTNGLNYYGAYTDIPDYYITGSKIGISPTPNITRTGAISITYIQQLEDIDASTDSSLPDEFHRLIALKAAIYAIGGKDEDDVQNLATMEQRLETNLFRTMVDRIIDEPTFISNDDEYFMG